MYVEALLLTVLLQVLLPGIHTLLQSDLLVGIGGTDVVSEHSPRIDLEGQRGVTGDHIVCCLSISPMLDDGSEYCLDPESLPAFK